MLQFEYVHIFLFMYLIINNYKSNYARIYALKRYKLYDHVTILKVLQFQI